MRWAGLRILLATACAAGVLGSTLPAVALDDASGDVTAAREAWRGSLEAWADAHRAHVEARAVVTAAARRASDAGADLEWIASELELARGRLARAVGERDTAAARLELATVALARANTTFARVRSRIDAHAATIYKHGLPALGPIESLLRSDHPAVYVLHHRLSEAVLHDDDRAVRRARRALAVAVERHDRAAIEASVATAVWEMHDRDATALGEVHQDQQRHVRSASAALRGRTKDVETAVRAEDEAAVMVERIQGVLLSADPSLAASLEAERRAFTGTLVQQIAQDLPFLDDAPDVRPRTLPPILGYHCPVEGGIFTNDWAFPRPGGRSHEGTDVFAQRDVPIVAVARGQVVAVDAEDTHQHEHVTGDLGGRSVTVVTPTGERWYYAHLETIAEDVEVGVMLEAGAPIGTNGDSGNARGGAPHLHLGRYWQDQAVNPWPSLVVACR